jgi:hypothetical protein
LNNAPTDKQAEALIRELFQFVNNDRCPLSPRIRVLRDEIVEVDYSVTRLIQEVAGSCGRSALVPVIFSRNIFPHPATFCRRDHGSTGWFRRRSQRRHRTEAAQEIRNAA